MNSGLIIVTILLGLIFVVSHFVKKISGQMGIIYCAFVYLVLFLVSLLLIQNKEKKLKHLGEPLTFYSDSKEPDISRVYKLKKVYTNDEFSVFLLLSPCRISMPQSIPWPEDSRSFFLECYHGTIGFDNFSIPDSKYVFFEKNEKTGNYKILSWPVKLDDK